MGNENTITGLMIKDHKRLVKLFDQFDKSLGKDFDLTSKYFVELKNGIQRHFQTEEQAIFAFTNPDNMAHNGISNLMEQHEIILEMVNDIQNELAIKTDLDISGFKKYLAKHQMIEEGILYPKLDAELNEAQKQIIIKKITDLQLKS